MRTHVKTLAILQIVYGAIGILIGLCVLALFGGLAALVGAGRLDRDIGVAVPVLMGIGGLVFLVMFALCLPRIIAGAGLLNFRNWARILTIIISALGLMDMPIGTALGVYGFWVLLSQEGAALFEGPSMRTA